MVNFHFVIVDSKERFCIPDDKLIGIQIPGVQITYTYHKNNTVALSKIYNSHIDRVRQYHNSDYIVFLHGDVSFDVPSFIRHIISLDNKYAVVGLAGTKRMKISQTPLNWFTSSNPFPNSRYGDVTMTQCGVIRAFYNQSYDPGTTDTDVACIDGLCIIFCKDAINSELRFDESLPPFDFYDTDISLQCVMKYKLKLGVMVEPVIHHSVGMSIVKEKFKEDEVIFRHKWNI